MEFDRKDNCKAVCEFQAQIKSQIEVFAQPHRTEWSRKHEYESLRGGMRFFGLFSSKKLTKQTISWHTCAYNAWGRGNNGNLDSCPTRQLYSPATQLPELTPILIFIFSNGRCGMQNDDMLTSKSSDIKAISDACCCPTMLKRHNNYSDHQWEENLFECLYLEGLWASPTRPGEGKMKKVSSIIWV